MNTLAVFCARPPVKPATDATAGSFWTMDCSCASFCAIAWKEMLWSAMICPCRMPLSCSGKNVEGTRRISATFNTIRPMSNRPTRAAWSSTAVSERE